MNYYFYFRFQVAVGSNGKTTDILNFSDFEIEEIIIIPNLNMIEGSSVSVTVRAYNKAGLYGQKSSEAVSISPNPKLLVYDGPNELDVDFQQSLSSLEGIWRYSDNCHVVSVEWAVESVDGKLVQKFTSVPSALHHFYSDLIVLRNGLNYINVIRTIDALGRVRISRSDGITVKIQPPSPGVVRDGHDDDINYQESNTELNVNWDNFGDSNSKDPTEKIVRYEVAVGNDIRFEETRSNVHYFVDVGLKNNHTFTGLNLTMKTVTYYATVRAYSEAGSIQIGISNGIKVGFNEVLVSGNVEYNAVQSRTDMISVSWSGFEADLGIGYFLIGISSSQPLIPNDTQECQRFGDFESLFDIKKLENVGKDTFAEIKEILLVHGRTYYTTFIAADVTEKCIGSTGKALLIDTTPPQEGNVVVEGKYDSNVVYVKTNDQLTVNWDGFQDNESSITHYEVNLFSATTCQALKPNTKEIPDIYKNETSIRVHAERRVTFYELSLKESNTYVISITAHNAARLKTTSISIPIRCDISPPSKGSVKSGNSWFQDISFQSYTNSFNGTIAVAHSKSAYICERQQHIFPAVEDELITLTGRFDPQCVLTSDSMLNIEIRHDDNLRGIIKGGVESRKRKLRSGNYSMVIRTAKGKNIVTTIFLASGSTSVKEDFRYIQEKESSTNKYVHLYHAVNSANNVTSSESNDGMSTTPRIDNSTFPTSNNSDSLSNPKDINLSEKISNFGQEGTFGLGFHLPGYTFNDKWIVFVWVLDQYTYSTRQVLIDFDPISEHTEYSIQISNSTSSAGSTWDVVFFIKNRQVAQFTGLQFENVATFGTYNWNEDDYVPPILNVDFPIAFYTSSSVKSMKEPIPDDKPCMHGLSFFDEESYISEIWVKVSDSENDVSSSGYVLHSMFCKACMNNCNIGCSSDCEPSPLEFELISLYIENLNLSIAKLISDGTNGSTATFNGSTHFLHVMAVNAAGLKSHAISKGVMVDITPPEFNYVRCVDPLSPTQEPSLYQGSNDSLRAYWDCDEDVGEITEYRIDAGTLKGIVNTQNIDIPKMFYILF